MSVTKRAGPSPDRCSSLSCRDACEIWRSAADAATCLSSLRRRIDPQPFWTGHPSARRPHRRTVHLTTSGPVGRSSELPRHARRADGTLVRSFLKGELMEPLQVILRRAKETKNTVRYEEPESDQPLIIGTLYVQKWALHRLGDPETLTITVAPG
jgi:hypothetical protein